MRQAVVAVILCLLVGCIGSLEVVEQFKSLTLTLYTVEGGEPQKCLVDNIVRFTEEYPFPYECDVRGARVQVVKTTNRQIGGLFIPPCTININDAAESQLAVFGHEWVRCCCYKSGECKWNQPSKPTWPGIFSVLWNDAEDLANALCPRPRKLPIQTKLRGEWWRNDQIGGGF